MVIDDTLYADEIKAAAKKHGLPPELVRALIKKESRFRADQIGEAGEVGLMQILPQGAAAEWARVNKCKVPDKNELQDVKTNLEIGCWYLARAIKKWKDYRYGMELALAEYNAGAKNSARWKPEKKNDEVIHRIDFPSTRKYVTEIMHDYREYLIQAMK
jgi:soluble lytic murein transglycosylase